MSDPLVPAQRQVAAKSFCEFFAGIGLVREALAASGWKCLYANDLDAKKQELYQGRFGREEHYHLGDVWNTDEVLARLSGSSLADNAAPRATAIQSSQTSLAFQANYSSQSQQNSQLSQATDSPLSPQAAASPLLATASFPCTDMSLAGRQEGFEGRESSAFFGFARVLERLGDTAGLDNAPWATLPRMVLLENVVGFLTARDGRDFAAALRTLADLGYWLDAFVLDAKDFVPQSRPRLFVVGMLPEPLHPALRRQVAGFTLGADPWRAALDATPRLRPARLRALMERLELPTGWATVLAAEPRPRAHDLGQYLDAGDEQEWWPAALVAKHLDMLSPAHAAQVEKWRARREPALLTGFRRIRQGRQRLETRFDGLAGCLRTPRGGSARQIVLRLGRGETRMRWMSPREYARLQGAPDYPLNTGTHQALFGFGDAVCVPVIRWIDQRVLTPLATGGAPPDAIT